MISDDDDGDKVPVEVWFRGRLTAKGCLVRDTTFGQLRGMLLLDSDYVFTWEVRKLSDDEPVCTIWDQLQ